MYPALPPGTELISGPASPRHQQMWKAGLDICAGFGLFAAALDGIANSFALITYPVTIAGTVTAVLLLALWRRYHQAHFSWRFANKWYKVFPNGRYRFQLAGMVLLLWTPHFLPDPADTPLEQGIGSLNDRFANIEPTILDIRTDVAVLPELVADTAHQHATLLKKLGLQGFVWVTSLG